MRQLRIENYLILHSSFFTLHSSLLYHLSPFATHWLVDKQISCLVAYEELCLGVEMQCAVQTQRTNAHVYDGGTVVTVTLVEGKLTTGANALQEVGIAWLRIGHLIDELLHIGDGALEALIDLTLRTFDVGNLAFALESFALEDNLTTVLVGVGYLTPDTHCIGMLLRGINLDLNGERVVLAQDVLNGVDVVLTHISQTATVIIEVTAEGLVCTMNIIWLVGSRA